MPAGLPTMPTSPAAPANAANARGGEAGAAAGAAHGAAGARGDCAHGGCFPAERHGDAFSLLLDAPSPASATAPAPAVAREPTDEAPPSDTASTVLPGQLLAMLGLAVEPDSDARPVPDAAPVIATTAQATSHPRLQTGAAADSAIARPLPSSPVAAAPAIAVTASAQPAADPGASAALAAAIAPAASEAASAPEPAARGADAIAALVSTPSATPTETLRATVPPMPPSTLAQPADPGAGYGDEFGANLVWMADRRLGHAEIRLNPEHLGPIDVHVQLEGERVRAEFHSAHAEVRQALEASLPRLRDLLGQHGLQLAQADVGQRRGEGQQAHAHPGHDRRDGGDAPTAQSQVRAQRARGLLDEYA